MRIRKPILPILAKMPWPIVGMALVLLVLITALGIGAAQQSAAPPEPLAAPQPTLAPPESPRPTPRGHEIALPLEVIIAPEPAEAAREAAPQAAKDSQVQYRRPRRLFRRGR